MTAPFKPPEGYSFFVGDYNGALFQDPAGWGITDPDSDDAKRIMTVHEVCGCVVAWGKIDAHDAMHAAIGA